jgi:hypothetical protein
MSDLLTRLAERALGFGSTVQPKLPRRFAPLPPAPGSDEAFWAEELRRALELQPSPLQAEPEGER